MGLCSRGPPGHPSSLARPKPPRQPSALPRPAIQRALPMRNTLCLHDLCARRPSVARRRAYAARAAPCRCRPRVSATLPTVHLQPPLTLYSKNHVPMTPKRWNRPLPASPLAQSRTSATPAPRKPSSHAGAPHRPLSSPHPHRSRAPPAPVVPRCRRQGEALSPLYPLDTLFPALSPSPISSSPMRHTHGRRSAWPEPKPVRSPTFCLPGQGQSPLRPHVPPWSSPPRAAEPPPTRSSLPYAWPSPPPTRPSRPCAPSPRAPFASPDPRSRRSHTMPHTASHRACVIDVTEPPK